MSSIIDSQDSYTNANCSSTKAICDPNPYDTETKGVSLKKVAAFAVILGSIFAAGTLYQDALFQLTREVILQLSQDLGETKMSFFKNLSNYTEEEYYILLSLALCPFLSRERFWYYIVGMQLSNYTKSNIKMVMSEPRPTWVWSDIPSYGCATSFGSPSGHSTRSANLVFMILLDLFFPSNWSLKKMPHLNTYSPRKNPFYFTLAVLFVCTFWPLCVTDRIVLGKHTLNQVLLGSQTGIWSAFFTHFVLRDCVFSHVRRITSAGTGLDKKTARSYIFAATWIVTIAYSLMIIIGLVSQATHTMKQEWLINLRDTCGKVYETDENGLLIPNNDGMYTGTLVYFASIFGYYGLFIGQVLFRVRGYGKLFHDAYTSAGLIRQLIFLGCIYFLKEIPNWVQEYTTDDVSNLTKAVFIIGLPNFICLLTMSLYLPALASKAANYPKVVSEYESCDTFQELDYSDLEKAVPKDLNRSMDAMTINTNSLQEPLMAPSKFGQSSNFSRNSSGIFSLSKINSEV